MEKTRKFGSALKNIRIEQTRKLSFTVGLIAFVSCVFGVCLKQQSDPDIWFHLACGEEITKLHSVNIGAFGSWYAQAQGYSDFLHEWLFEVLIYRAYQAFGACALIGYTLLMGCLLVGLILKVFWLRLKEDPARIGVYLVLLIFSLAPFYSARPQLIQYVMFTFAYMMTTGLIGREWSFKRQCITWGILSVLWANLHGGSWILLLFFMAFMFLQAAPLPDIGRLRFGHNGDRAYAKRILILTAVVTGAGMINPHGCQLAVHTVHYMFTDSGTQYISEWQPMEFNNQKGYILLVMLFATVVQMIGSDEKIDFIDCEIMTSFLIETLLHVRNYPLAILSIVMWLMRCKPFVWVRDSRELQMFILPGILCGACLYGEYQGLTSLSKIIQNPVDQDSIISTEVIDAIKSSGCERLYNTYHLGDYLVFNGIDTFVDGRAQDMYTSKDVHDSVYVGRGGKEADGLVKKYKFDGFLIANDVSFYYNLEKGDYTKAAGDENVSFWVPTEPNTGGDTAHSAVR